MACATPATYDSTSFRESRIVASIQQDPQSKNFRIRFRYGGRRYFRSLKTTELRVRPFLETLQTVGTVRDKARI